MVRAMWKGRVIAETSMPQSVEGNIYYPPSSLKREFFVAISKTTTCGWKGTANYYDLKDPETGETAAGQAWYYADTKEAAANIKGHVAFYPSVTHVHE
ncbi:hypothetical protein T492DRAFT_1099257 [Pavlovales sp. CCMP2436]|nr:hypothetical protein T492DRAFT_1099257 [Pavlovales sp. CCMP2436]